MGNSGVYKGEIGCNPLYGKGEGLRDGGIVTVIGAKGRSIVSPSYYCLKRQDRLSQETDRLCQQTSGLTYG